MKEQHFLNILCFTFMIQPEKTCCTKVNTKALKPALMTGLTRSHITIFSYPLHSCSYRNSNSLLMFSREIHWCSRASSFRSKNNWIRWEVWEWGRLHYVPQGLLGKRCTSPRDQLAVVCTCQHNNTLHICMFPDCAGNCIVATGQRSTCMIKIYSN